MSIPIVECISGPPARAAQPMSGDGGQRRRAPRTGPRPRGRSSRRPRREVGVRRPSRGTRCPRAWIRSPRAVASGSRMADRTPSELVDGPVRPVSSRSSRRTPSAGSSPKSSPPPGSIHSARAGVRRRDPAQQDGVVALDPRVGGDTAPAGRRPRARRVTGAGARRGTADRGRGTRGRGRPSRGPSSHGRRRGARAAGRRRRTAPGRARNAWTTCETRSFAREPLGHRGGRTPRAPPAGARPRSSASIASAASRALTSARWSPSPVNGSRNPAASPTTSQPGPGAPLHPAAERARARDRVA